MATNEKKGVTVKIDAELHAEVRRYIEEHEMTMGEFVSLALQNELHPKLNIQTPTDSERVTEEHEERQETATVSDCESVSEEVGEQSEEQESADFSDDFDDENEESENLDEDEDLDESKDQDESEEMGISIGM